MAHGNNDILSLFFMTIIIFPGTRPWLDSGHVELEMWCSLARSLCGLSVAFMHFHLRALNSTSCVLSEKCNESSS